jgi:hypothetical protein
MNARQANQISIIRYLESQGIRAAKTYRNYTMYRSPFREESNPSMKVSHRQNLWVDFGEGSGGTLIDLVLRLHPGQTVKEAIREINQTVNIPFSFHQQLTSSLTKEQKQETERRIQIQHIKELGNNPAITHYIQSRGISIDTAREYCKELYFQVGRTNYFGVGHPNEHGWSIRNAYWKGCTAQGYSHYQKASRSQKSLTVFEGIFDLLSYLEIHRQAETTEDYLVLNSLVNVNKAIPILQEYHHITLYLDHDAAGRKATHQLLQVLPESRDCSGFYSTCKDLNEYYVLKNEEQLLQNKEQLIKNKEKSTMKNRSLRAEEASHVLVRPKRLHR